MRGLDSSVSSFALRLGLFATTFIAAVAACGAGSPPARELDDARRAIASAERTGASEHQPASAYLELAKHQLAFAEALIADGDHQRARNALSRSRSEAELAYQLARDIRTRDAALEAVRRIDALVE